MKANGRWSTGRSLSGRRCCCSTSPSTTSTSATSTSCSHWCAGFGLTTLVALRDLNLAATYCGTVVVPRNGRVLAAGVADVLTPLTVEAAFGIAASVVTHPATGRALLLFHLPETETP